MSSFATIESVPGGLYRGLSAPGAVWLAEHYGVGPYYELAHKVSKMGEEDINDDAFELIDRALDAEATRRRIDVVSPPSSLKQRAYLAAKLEGLPREVSNHLGDVDHIMSEYDALLSLPGSRVTDSVTTSPVVALLYAYGFLPKAHFANKPKLTRYTAWTEGLSPCIAVLASDSSAYTPFTGQGTSVEVWQQRRGVDSTQPTLEEVAKRVARDGEKLLRQVAVVSKLVSLPLLPKKKSMWPATLDQAAQCLVDAGVALPP